MPHDATGEELKVGDTVVMTFKVKAVYPNAEGCNVDLVAEGEDVYLPQVTCSSSLVCKVE